MYITKDVRKICTLGNDMQNMVYWIERETWIQEARIQILAQLLKFTGGVKLVKPLLKYLIYLESPIRVTVGRFRLDST